MMLIGSKRKGEETPAAGEPTTSLALKSPPSSNKSTETTPSAPSSSSLVIPNQG
jgi:hypothetical protein